MKKTLLLAICILTVSSFELFSQDNTDVGDAYLKAFREYAEKTKMTPIANGIFQMFVEKEFENLPPEEADKLRSAMPAGVDEFMASYIEEAAKIYEKHFSLKELRKINKFYNSPAGKKLSESRPEIVMGKMPLIVAIVEKMEAEFKAAGEVATEEAAGE